MIAFITGSGFYELDSITNPQPTTIETPFGAVPVITGTWRGGPEVVFLARHGSDHSIAPHLINYRANIWALHSLGVEAVIATAVSGAMDESMSVGDFVLIEDFIDFTNGRDRTFFDKPGELQHTEMGDPYDATLRELIAGAAADQGISIAKGGIYCATNGPRFETKAEIAMMKQVGGTLVGMTGCPEVVLANELGLRYASVAVISNVAAGLGDEEFTVAEILALLAELKGPLEELYDAILAKL